MHDSMMKKAPATLAVLALSAALLACAGCAPKSSAEAGTNGDAVAAAATEAPAAPETNASSVLTGPVTADDVDSRCLSCHLSSDLPGWNRDTVDAAMVESMLPTLSDDDVQAIADYFAAVEPQAQDGGPR